MHLGFAWFCMDILWFRVIYFGLLCDVCHSIGFVCRLKRDFKVLVSRYRIFSVFREKSVRTGKHEIC